jgi:hypothetical protein
MMRRLRSMLARTADLPGAERVDAVALRMLSSIRRAKAKHPNDPVIEQQYRRMKEIVQDSGRHA